MSIERDLQPVLPFGGLWFSLSIVAGAAWLLFFFVWANRASSGLPSGLLQRGPGLLDKLRGNARRLSLSRLRYTYR